VDADVAWQDRAHFYALAARMMRRLLINYATQRNRQKRGGDVFHVTLQDSKLGAEDTSDSDLLDIDAALSELEAFDPRKAELIQLQYFGGLTYEEMQEVTGLSSSTVHRDLRLAKAWLRTRLYP